VPPPHRGPGAPLVVAAAAVAVALAPSWLLGRVPIRSDALAYFWPLRARLAEALAGGELPLYDTLNDAGTPLLLNPQTAALYPPHLLYALLPLGWAYAWLHAGHLALLGVGTLRLVQRLGYGTTAASLGALTVALGGVALSVSAMQDKLFALAWAPWALAGLLAAVDRGGSRRGRVGGGLAAIAALALAVLGGGLDVVVMTVLVGVPLAALDGGRSRPSARAFVHRGAIATGCVVGAGLVAAVQWLPFADWLGTTDWSAGAAPAELLSRSLRPHHLLGLVCPNAGYVPALDSLRFPWRPPDPILFYQPGSYMGGAGLWLAAVGAVHGVRRPGPARVAAVGVGICLVLALGPALAPVGWAETQLPLLSMIRYPHKWAMLAALLGAVLVAEGVRALRAPSERPRLTVAVVAAAAATSGMLALAALVAPAVSDPVATVSWRQLFGGGAAACGIAAAVCLLLGWSARVRGGALRAALPGLAVALCAADLVLFNLPLAPVEEPAIAWAPSAAAATLASEAPPVRVFPFSYTAAGVYPDPNPGASLTQVLRESLFPGIPVGHGFVLPFGWLVMHPVHLRDTYAGLGPLPMAERLSRLRLAGVTHLLVHREEHLAPLLAIPTVALVDTVHGAACSVSILRLDAPLPDVRWTPRGDPTASGARVRIVTDGGGRFEARVHGDESGRLVWLRPWDPYWVATVDGAPVATERVNGHQLSIPVEPGDQVVALAYRVPSLAVGAGVSLVSSLGLLAVALVLLRRPTRAP
jgi:hypothetical protein